MRKPALPLWAYTALLCLHCALTVGLMLALCQVSLPVERGPLYFVVTVYLSYFPLLAVWAGVLAGRDWRCLPLAAVMFVSAGLWKTLLQYDFEPGAFLAYLALSLCAMALSRWLRRVLPGFRPVGWALGAHLPLYPALNLLAVAGGRPRLAEALWYLFWAGLAVWLGISAGRRFRQRFWMPLVPLCLLSFWDPLPPGSNVLPAVLALPYRYMGVFCLGLCAGVMLAAAYIMKRKSQGPD